MTYAPSPGGDAMELVAGAASSAGSLLLALVLIALVLSFVWDVLSILPARDPLDTAPSAPQRRPRPAGPAEDRLPTTRRPVHTTRARTIARTGASVRSHRRLVAACQLRRFIPTPSSPRSWSTVRYPH
ncbi:MAG: hypothetical protein U0893_16490 [Chloroflexota bacterium]